MKNVIPVSVPWNLHPYLADFRISAREEGSLDIIVNAYFAANDSIDTLFTEQEIFDNCDKGLLYTAEGFEKLSYQVVKISFERYFCFNVSHEHKDYAFLYSGHSQIYQPLLSDLPTNLPPYSTEYRKAIKQIIDETGNNPDPLFYEIVDDEPLLKPQKRLNMKKYLLCNKECNIDIVATEFTWQSLGALFRP